MLLTLSLTSGCLSSSYRISREEVLRLAALRPMARGDEVRATQEIGGGDNPPANVASVIQPSQLLVPEAVTVSQPVRFFPVRRHVTGNVGGNSGSTSGSAGSGGSSSSGNLDPRVVLVAVVLVGAAVFVLAGTEGARYDGWLGMDPQESLYLNTDVGTVEVPLMRLTPELAARSYGATVYEGSQERFGRLRRAPFNRVGGTVQAAVGAVMVPNAAGTTSWGVGGSAFVGGFFLQQLGLGLAMDISGSDGNLYGTIGGEVQLMPLTHLGAYAAVGYAGLLSSGSRGGTSLRGGLQAELPITTRLSARVRAGVAHADLSDTLPGPYLAEFSVGMSVY